MKRILAFAGSNSSKSINQQLVKYAATLVKGHETKIIDLRDYPAPIYCIDIEENEGFPAKMKELNLLFKECDGFIISSPEYNGSIPPVFKNTIDWISRIERPTFKNKPMLLMSTSTGERGGKTNLEYVESKMPRWGANVVATFSLANFFQNMDQKGNNLNSIDEKGKLIKAISILTNTLNR